MNRLSKLLFGALIVVVAVAGVVERVSLLRHPTLQPDSDETLSGLMALHLLNGDAPTFLWGQPYGGTAEVYLIAPFVQVFGPNLWGMRFFTVLLGVIAPLLIWRVATRLMSKTGAIATGLVLWIWPVAFVAWSLREYLYYQPLITLGLLGMLFTYRSLENPQSRWQPAVVGVALGLGFWMSPFIAYFGLFCVLIAAQHRQWLLRRGWIAVVAGVAGALPWFAYNLPRSLISLQTPSGAPRGSYIEHLEQLARLGLPVILGVKGWWTGYWIEDSRKLGLFLIGTAIVLTVVAFVLGFRNWIRKTASMPADLMCLAAWPFLYALSPMATTKAVYAPRYWVLLWPFLAFVAGRLMSSRKTIYFGMAGLLVLASYGVRQQKDRWLDWPDTGALRTAMHERGVDHFFGSYWVTYRVSYETNERVIGTPAYPLSVRWDPYDAAVHNDADPAWVFRRGDMREKRFVEYLSTNHIAYQAQTAGAYALYMPDRKIVPADLPVNVALDPAEGD